MSQSSLSEVIEGLYDIPYMGLSRQSAEAIEAALAHLKRMQWISVEEQMPRSGQRVEMHWVNSLGNGRTSMGTWVAPFSVEESSHSEALQSGEEDFDYVEADDIYYRKTGWYEEPWEFEHYALVCDEVLMWRKITPPEPPSE